VVPDDPVGAAVAVREGRRRKVPSEVDRVYRMEGPKVNGPGQPVTRLTADPVADHAFTDPIRSSATGTSDAARFG
jgi:hypothetical protein